MGGTIVNDSEQSSTPEVQCQSPTECNMDISLDEHVNLHVETAAWINFDDEDLTGNIARLSDAHKHKLAYSLGVSSHNTILEHS